ncbi:MAG: GIY-YIG nuclease superfamily protein [Syntrophorhabdus sp. PtaB.Bin047]|jgi:putative endonuclease|nr:MAG: GIY-YIG nuclease superfamily protein [Syntrophorhabdus sp. PtaB.Bin047]
MTAMTDSTAIFVYILECSDRTLYCGWTNNLQKRLEEHSAGKAGAKYTRGRRPVRLVYREPCPTRSDALKREREIKRLSRTGKLLLIEKAAEGRLI